MVGNKTIIKSMCLIKIHSINSGCNCNTSLYSKLGDFFLIEQDFDPISNTSYYYQANHLLPLHNAGATFIKTCQSYWRKYQR